MLGSAPPCPTLLCVPPPRLETVVVGVTDVVDVTVTLRNRGEDSYGTTVQLHHAAALSYRKAVVLQVTPPEPSSAWKTPQKSPRPSRSAFGLLKLFPTRSRLPTRPRGRPTPLGTSLRFPTSPRGLPTPLQTSSRPPEVYLASPTPPQPSSRSSVGSRGLRNLLRVLSIPKPRNETSHIPACPPQALQRCRWPPKPFRMSSKAPRSPSGLPTSPDPPPRVVSPPPPDTPSGGRSQSSRRSGSLRCNSEPAEGPRRRTVCLVNHPIFRPGAEVAGVPARPPVPTRSGTAPREAGRGPTPRRPVPQVVFAVSLDVPPGAELGRALEVVADAGR